MKASSIAKYLLPALGAIALGFVIFQNLDAIMRAVQEQTSPIINAIKPFIAQIMNMWNSIPDSIKGVITLGIPTAFALFFAWTKTRAMQKLQQVQTQATATITNLEGNKELLQSQLTSKATEVSRLQSQITDPTVIQNLLSAKDTEISKLQKDLQTQIQRVNNIELSIYQKVYPQIICRRCQTSYPASREYCPTCQTPQLIQK